MSFITIVLFFVYCYGLGFTVSSFVKNSENFLERNLMRLGFGLSLLPFLALVLNIINIPADWRIILALSLVYPLYYLLRNYKKFGFSFKLTKTSLSIFAMLVIFFVNFYIYGTGAFSYPYLEDDDSWSHAIGVKYYSIEKNVYNLEAERIRYINPYPPTYDILLGILHQTNDSIYWTMKFFNALIISLSTVFFYFFVKEFTSNKNKALFAAFALLSIPAFLSHFIWAISFAIPLYFIVFYAIERIKYDKKWWILAGAVMVATLTSTPTHSTYFSIFFVLYFLTKIFLEKKMLVYHALAGLTGVILSFVFWWLPMIIKYGFFGVLQGFGLPLEDLEKSPGGISTLTNIGGTGDRFYSISDFVFAQKANMINNPIGIGVVLSLLLIVALIFTSLKYLDLLKKNKKIVLVSFFVVIAVVLFFLFSTYIGKFWISIDLLEQSVPFNIFLSDQIFLIISWTFMIFILATLVIVRYTYKDFKNDYLVITVVWLVFAFYAVNAGPYQFRLSPFRSWMLLAIPVCILAAEGAFGLMGIAKKSAGNLGKYAILIILLTGIYFTSTQQKIAVNTATWPPGAFWTSGEEIGAYVWMKDNLPKNSNVFTFVNNGPVIGMDMYTCHWCDDVRGYMKNGFNQSTQETYDWLKKNNYEYLAIDGQTVRKFGANESNIKLQGLVQSGLFQPVFQNQGAVFFKIE